MVPGAGLEPARGFPRGILNPLCLPISPPGQSRRVNTLGKTARILCNLPPLCKQFSRGVLQLTINTHFSYLYFNTLFDLAARLNLTLVEKSPQ